MMPTLPYRVGVAGHPKHDRKLGHRGVLDLVDVDLGEGDGVLPEELGGPVVLDEARLERPADPECA